MKKWRIIIKPQILKTDREFKNFSIQREELNSTTEIVIFGKSKSVLLIRAMCAG